MPITQVSPTFLIGCQADIPLPNGIPVGTLFFSQDTGAGYTLTSPTQGWEQTFGPPQPPPPAPVLLQPIDWVFGSGLPLLPAVAKTGITYPISSADQSQIAPFGPATIQREVIPSGSPTFPCTGWYENAIFAAGKDPRNPAGWAGAGSAGVNWSANNKPGAPDGSSTGAQASAPSAGFSQYQRASGLVFGKPSCGYSWVWQGSGTTSSVAGVDMFTAADHWSGVPGGVPISASPTRVSVKLQTAALTTVNSGLVPADGRDGTLDVPVGPPAGIRDYYVACSQITQSPEPLPFTDTHTSGYLQFIPGNAWYDESGYFDVIIDDEGTQFLFSGAPITLLARDYYFWYVDPNNNLKFRASDLKFVFTVNGVSLVSASVSLPAPETNIGVVRIQHQPTGMAITVGANPTVSGPAQPATAMPDLVYLNCDGITAPLASSNVIQVAKPLTPFVRYLGNLVPTGVVGAATPIRRLLTATGTSQVFGTGASTPTFNVFNVYQQLLGASSWDARNFGVAFGTVAQLQAVDYARIDEMHNSLRPKRIIVCWGGTDDLYNSVTGATSETDAQIAARILQWATDRAAQGDPVQVVGIIARGSNGTYPMTAPQVTSFNNRAFTINSLVDAGCLGPMNRLYYVSAVTSSPHFTPGDGVTPSGAQNDTSYYTNKFNLTDLGQGSSGVAGMLHSAAVANGLV